MGNEPRPTISDAEREVLKALWELGPSLVRDVVSWFADSDPPWSRSTVITLLQRLEKKRYVGCDRSGFAFRFRARVTREELAAQRLNEVAAELYSGDPAPLVLAFAEQHKFTNAEIKQLREMIDQQQTPNGKRKKKR